MNSTNRPDALVSIIMRSFNEAWALKGTLSALQQQDYKNWELIVIDSGSSDGSQQLIRAAQPHHFIQILPQDYNPSKVMNAGMRLASSNICIFLNADATPSNPQWLRPLVEALTDPQVAACYGRQLPRPNCLPVVGAEYERCFGSHPKSQKWEHFFSMVSSGIRKDIWVKRGFREDLQYAEDDEYTRWCKNQGYQVRYIPASCVYHSHDYTPQQAKKRAYGDALAIGKAWYGNKHNYSWTKTVLAGTLKDVIQDTSYLIRNRQIQAIAHVLKYRFIQRTARLSGFKEGLAQRNHPNTNQ